MEQTIGSDGSGGEVIALKQIRLADEDEGTYNHCSHVPPCGRHLSALSF